MRVLNHHWLGAGEPQRHQPPATLDQRVNLRPGTEGRSRGRGRRFVGYRLWQEVSVSEPICQVECSITNTFNWPQRASNDNLEKYSPVFPVVTYFSSSCSFGTQKMRYFLPLGQWVSGHSKSRG